MPAWSRACSRQHADREPPQPRGDVWVGQIMRYELTDHEWAAIKPMLPSKPRGVPRVDDRRVPNGIFWVLRSFAAWRDPPPHPLAHAACASDMWRVTRNCFVLSIE